MSVRWRARCDGGRGGEGGREANYMKGYSSGKRGEETLALTLYWAFHFALFRDDINKQVKVNPTKSLISRITK